MIGASDDIMRDALVHALTCSLLGVLPSVEHGPGHYHDANGSPIAVYEVRNHSNQSAFASMASGVIHAHRDDIAASVEAAVRTLLESDDHVREVAKGMIGRAVAALMDKPNDWKPAPLNLDRIAREAAEAAIMERLNDDRLAEIVAEAAAGIDVSQARIEVKLGGALEPARNAG